MKYSHIMTLIFSIVISHVIYGSEEIVIKPEKPIVFINESIQFSAYKKNSQGVLEKVDSGLEWKVKGGGQISTSGEYKAGSKVGKVFVGAFYNESRNHVVLEVLEDNSKLLDIVDAWAESQNEISTPLLSIDQDYESRWESEHIPQTSVTYELDLVKWIGKIVIHWEAARAAEYEVLLSNDGDNWENVRTVHSEGSLKDTVLINKDAKYIQLNLLERATVWGYSIFEFEVYGK